MTVGEGTVLILPPLLLWWSRAVPESMEKADMKGHIGVVRRWSIGAEQTLKNPKKANPDLNTQDPKP